MTNLADTNLNQTPLIQKNQNYFALSIEPEFYRQIQETNYSPPQIFTVDSDKHSQELLLEYLITVEESLNSESAEKLSQTFFFDTLCITPSNWLNFTEVFCADYPQVISKIKSIAVKVATYLIQKDINETTLGLDNDPATLRAAEFLRPLLVVKKDNQVYAINYGYFVNNADKLVCPESGWFRITDGKYLYDLLMNTLQINIDSDQQGGCIDVETKTTSTGDQYIFAISAGEDQDVPEQESVGLSARVFSSLDVAKKYQWQYLGDDSLNILGGQDGKSISFVTPKVVKDGHELSFMLTVTDVYGNQVQDVVTLTVNNTVNELPEVALQAPRQIRAGQPFHVEANIVDENPDDTFTHSWKILEFPDLQPKHVEDDHNKVIAKFITPHVDAKTKITLQLVVQDNAMREAGIETPTQIDLVVLPNTLPTVEMNVPEEIEYGREVMATAWATDPDYNDKAYFTWRVIDHPEIEFKVVTDHSGFSKVKFITPFVTEPTEIQVEVAVQDKALTVTGESVTQVKTIRVLPNVLPQVRMDSNIYRMAANRWFPVRVYVTDENDRDTISYEWEATAYEGYDSRDAKNPFPVELEVQEQDNSHAHVWVKTPDYTEDEEKFLKIKVRVQDDYLRETAQFIEKSIEVRVDESYIWAEWAAQTGDFYAATRETGGEYTKSEFEFKNPSESVKTLIEKLNVEEDNPEIYQLVFLIDESGSMYPIADMLASESNRIINKIVEEAGVGGQVQVALYGYVDSGTRSYLEMTEVISVSDADRLEVLKRDLSKAAEKASERIKSERAWQETIWHTIGELLEGGGVMGPRQIQWGEYENFERRIVVLTDFELNSTENIIDKWTPETAGKAMKAKDIEFWPVQYSVPWGC